MPLTVAYTDVGAGDTVLLLHGILTWSYLYHDVILLEPHCRVLAPIFSTCYSDRRDRFDRLLRAQTRMILKFLDAWAWRRPPSSATIPVAVSR
jgi:pimeloyl-ACP methyl ester carboxylesterase